MSVDPQPTSSTTTAGANARPRALNHLHLTAENPEEEMAFLEEVLGFRRDPNLPGFVWLGNMQLAVTKGEPVRSARFHLGFRMDSRDHVDGLRERLIAHGVEASEPFSNGSFYTFAFTDPAGYQMEVYADGGIPALGTLQD